MDAEARAEALSTHGGTKLGAFACVGRATTTGAKGGAGSLGLTTGRRRQP